MLAEIMRRIARVFGRPGDRVLFPQDLSALQDHLLQTCGGVVIACPCGGTITPILYIYASRTTVEALACVGCHNVVALKKRGVIDRNAVITSMNEAESLSPAGATVH
jgi:hypothetical protein